MPIDNSSEVIHTFYPIGLVLILVGVSLAALLIFKRNTFQSKQKVMLIVLISIVISFTIGWLGREYVDVYEFNHPTPYIDCPTC